MDRVRKKILTCDEESDVDLPVMRNQRRGKGADEASEVEQKVKKGDREGGGRAANTILVLKQIYFSVESNNKIWPEIHTYLCNAVGLRGT